MGDKFTYSPAVGAMFIQTNGPATQPVYIGEGWDVDSLSEPRGDVELHQMISRTGNFKSLGVTKGPPGLVTTSMTTYISAVADYLESIDCPSAVLYFMLRCGGPAGVFTNYERSFFFNVAAVTSIDRSNLLSRTETGPAEQSFSISGVPPIYRGFEWSPVRLTTTEASDLNAIAADSEETCQSGCSTANAACTDFFGVAKAVSGSPSDKGGVIKSTDGTTITLLATLPFAVTEDISAVSYFRIDRDNHRVLVARGTTDASNPAEVAYSDDAGVTWTNVDVGSTNAQFVQSANGMFALDANHIWLVTNDGYVYKSTNGGATWTTQDSGSITTGIIYGIHFADPLYGYMAANTDIVAVTTDGGATWTQKTATGEAANLLDVHVHDKNFAFVTTANGKIFVTFDGGTTWNERTFSGSGSSSSSVPSIDFLNEYQGVLVHTLTGGNSKLFTTIDGGYNWEEMGNLPTNSGINDAKMCSETVIYAVGDVQGSTAYVLKATAG